MDFGYFTGTPYTVWCVKEQEAFHYYDATVRTTYKDKVFIRLMREKGNLLSVYNALNKTSYTDEENLEIATLEDAVYMKYKNDVSFLFHSCLTLYEHQSTYNPNMPLRELIYVAAQLGRRYYRHSIYGSRQIKIPTPKFVVFYNGTAKRPGEEILKLSDAFMNQEEEPDLELKVRMININPGCNDEILKNCQILKEYSQFVECVRKYTGEHSIGESVTLAVDECIEKNILRDFLIKQKSEVIAAMIFEYNEEVELEKLRRTEYEYGMAKSKAEDILEILEDMGEVPEDVTRKLMSEENLDILRKWLKRALCVKSVEEFAVAMQS